MFNFNKRFQIHDDIDILKRMGLLFGKHIIVFSSYGIYSKNQVYDFYIYWILISGLDKGECSEEEIERAKSMVPKSLESYVEREYF